MIAGHTNLGQVGPTSLATWSKVSHVTPHLVGLGSSTIICPNFKFGQVIVRDYLWNPLD
jgi:hypothetical protein